MADDVVDNVDPSPDSGSATAPAAEDLSEARAQESATIALIHGERVQELPTDLYIPPEALEVFLETFQGPLDLLLYLIRRQNLDILDIKVAEITKQYMQYIDLMHALQLELAGEYLVMAAMLAEIKSRMLLPRVDSGDEEEGDPRAELIRRLQEYEQIKTGAENIGEAPRVERDIHLVAATKPELVRQHADPEVDIKDVLLAMARVLKRAEMFASHEVQLEPLSVRDRMGLILGRVRDTEEFVSFYDCFVMEEGRMGVIVTFLAIMELVRESLVEFVQAEPYAPIHVRAVASATDQTPVFLTNYGGETDNTEAEED
ncbi:MAG: segregation/condensation protein A [Pseudomonadales bacterium]|nr:segregation/condensation protein A [Pseudomonadales bacterium]